jgi:hypothetical protein
MIDRRNLLVEQLADASQRVIGGEGRIQRHKQAIIELHRVGRDIAIAQELLEMAISTHAVQVAARDRLKAQLSQL